MKKLFTLALLTFLSLGLTAQIYIDENFDDDIPSDWTTSSEADSYPWFYNDGTGFQSLNGTGYARVDADAAGSVNNLVENLESPEFDASAGNIIIVQFETYYNDYIGLDTGYVQVWDGSVWHTAWQIGEEFGSWASPENVTVIITDYINASGDTKIRFRYDDGDTWAWYWAIDNVVVSSVDCLEPQQLNVDVLGAISATVSWNSGSGTSNLAYGPTGFDPDDIAGTGGTLIDPADSPYEITGLDPETTYDFYVQDDCGVNGMSAWAGPYTFTTTIACPAPIFFNFSNPTATSIEINFGQNDGDVYIIYGEAGFMLGSDGDTVGVATSPYTLTGLDALTFYDVYLFMDCSADDLGTSLNTGPWSFNTLVDGPGTDCANPIILNGTLPDDSWESTGQSICGYGDNLTTSPTTCGWWVSGYEEIVFVYAPEEDEEILGIYATNFTTGSNIYFEIVENCPDSADASCVANGFWDSWVNDPTFLLDGVELTMGTEYYITVTGWTGNGCLLDLEIFIVNCPTPTSLTAESFEDGTADLDWTSNSEASNWQLEWDTAGFTPGTGNIVDGEYGVDGPPYTIDGLTDQYNYEFYIVDICGFGDLSIAAGPFEFSGPPPSNNLCENAIPLECGTSTPGNTGAATDEGNSPSSCNGWSSAAGGTVWYSFTGDGNEAILSTCGAGWDTEIYVYTGDCDDDLECIAYSDGNWVGGTNQCDFWGDSYLSMLTEDGQEYYVAVNGYGGFSSGTFDLLYECIPCSAPSLLTVSTLSDTQAQLNWNTFNIGADYNYEFGLGGFGLGSGTPGSGVVGTDGPPVIISGLLPGTLYDFYVWETCTDGSGSDTLSISFTTNLNPPPANDLCTNAILLECGDSDTASTLNATSFGNPLGGLCGNDFNIMEGNTVWWEFVGTGGEVNISTCGSNFTTDLFIMTGSCEEMECVVQSAYNSGPCGDWNSTEVSILAEEGETYYISVSPVGTWTAGGEAIVTIECIPCSAPTNVVASVTDVSANISWTSFNVGADYTLVWGEAGFDYPDDGTTLTGTNDDLPVMIDGLVASGVYDVYIYEYCEDEMTNSDTVMTSFVTNAFPPPANDAACSAVALEPGVVLETTNIYATIEIGEIVPPATGCNDPNQGGWCNSILTSSTWYTFTPDVGGMTTITTCHEGSYDTQLACYMVDDCGDFSTYSLVAANDDNGTCAVATTWTSTIEFCSEANVTYYIQVDPYSSFGNPTGADFSISVDILEAEVNSFLAFPTPFEISLSFDYVSTVGDPVDFVIYYTNQTTMDVDTAYGNTGNLPMSLDGLDDNTEYEILIVCEDDCSTLSGPHSVTTPPNGIGIEELSFGANVKVYPNPANELLVIEINSELEVGSRIQLLDMQGKIVFNERILNELNEYRNEISTSDLAPGMYLLQISDDENSIQERIVIQH